MAEIEELRQRAFDNHVSGWSAVEISCSKKTYFAGWDAAILAITKERVKNEGE